MWGKTYSENQLPIRQWSLVAYPTFGKSTFANAFIGSGVGAIIDADQRFSEVVRNNTKAFPISDKHYEMLDPDAICKILDKQMPGSPVTSLVVDSLTAIIEPLVVQALIDNEKGLNKNRAVAFKEKALAMRQLQNGITKWGVDTLWIYHYRDGNDQNAKSTVSTTITTLELARLRRNLNVMLELVQENGKYGVKVNYARRGRSGMTLWDTPNNYFVGMPERIEEAVYSGLTKEDQDQLAKKVPETFTNPESAIAWGFEFSQENGHFFKDAQHVKNSYEKLKGELRDQLGDELTADVMYASWIAKVLEKQTVE